MRPRDRLARAEAAGEQIAVDGEHGRGLVEGLADELDAEPADAAGDEDRHEIGGRLELAVEDRVPTADVDDHRMRAAGVVAERQLVALARAAAGAEVATLR